MDSDETASFWQGVPGGADVVQWFGGIPSFHDGEVLRLHLDRGSPSFLEIWVQWWSKEAAVTFFFDDWIDVDIRGFSHQNVIGSLAIKEAGERHTAPWELGVGLTPGKLELALGPCVGAYGSIRATVSRVEIVTGDAVAK